MTLGTLADVVCIVFAFITGFSDKHELLFDPITWFVAAIAIVMTLGGVGPVFGKPAPKSAE